MTIGTSNSDLQATISQIQLQLTNLQQNYDALANERLLYNLIQDYTYLHDRCFGKRGTPEDDAKWESLFTFDGVSDLHPLGVHHGQKGKMSCAQELLGGRGQGCQIMISNVRVTLDNVASTSAIGQAYAVVTVVPDDAAHTVTVKGQYVWKFEKVKDVWKVASVKLSPFPHS